MNSIESQWSDHVLGLLQKMDTKQDDFSTRLTRVEVSLENIQSRLDVIEQSFVGYQKELKDEVKQEQNRRLILWGTLIAGASMLLGFLASFRDVFVKLLSK